MRMPVVADRFYPADPQTLRAMIGEMTPSPGAAQAALAVISPHAGYVYSGAVAAETIARVAVPETVIVLGPNHTGRGAPVALGLEDWSMPFGPVAVDRELAAALLEEAGDLVTADEAAHRFEHSLEVQVPFLQWRRPSVRIVPLVVDRLPFDRCKALGLALARVAQAAPYGVLLLASTDMTHYEPRRSARRKDELALRRVLALDPAGLYETVLGQRISMCGVMPTVAVLVAALALGATSAELVRYTDSGAVSGDTEQVVGYAGVVVR